MVGDDSDGNDLTFLLKTKIYRISRTPTVLIISKTTNHGLLPDRAAFHKAQPFHIKLQITNGIKNNNSWEEKIPAPQ
jgi:hypothetical protein